MKSFATVGVLALCLGAPAIIAGCSRNLGAPDTSTLSDTSTASSENKTTTRTSQPESARQETSPSQKSPSETGAPAKSAAGGIVWETDLKVAMQKARAAGKPVMIDFYADWCGPCKYLDAEIYAAPEVAREAKNFINVKIDGDKAPALALSYEVKGYPTILFLDAKGKEVQRNPGIPIPMPPSEFVQLMQKARAAASA